ncbi:MAG: 30S ribosomal protein S8 [candidate division Zixibacteria bacterium]|nr:30S ribosomal protein S8 [candidate division Zixibacteria bacterium]
MTDPVADMLTRLRNANKARQVRVEFPYSGLREAILKVLYEHRYIRGYARLGEKKPVLRAALRFGKEGVPMITGLKRVSKPGRRVYADTERLATFGRRLGMTVVSTSRGVLAHPEALRQGVGGEVLLQVW